jgi:hypothetical protein
MQPYPPTPPRSSSPAPWIALAAVGVIAAGLLGFAVGRSSATAGTVTTRTVTAAPAATMTTQQEPDPTTEAAAKPRGIPEGTHVVGRDIEPGEYRTDGPARGRPCYWARLSDTTGDSSSILANGNIEGPTTVTILAADGAFETSSCQPWVKVG